MIGEQIPETQGAKLLIESRLAETSQDPIDKLEIPSLTPTSIYNLNLPINTRVTDRYSDDEIRQNLPDHVDVSKVSEFGALLLSKYMKGDEEHVHEIAERMPPQIDISRVSEGGFSLLVSFIYRGYAPDIIHSLEAPISLGKLDSSALRMLGSLFEVTDFGIDKKVGKEEIKVLWDKLEDKVDVENMSHQSYSLLDLFLKKGYRDQMLEKFPGKLDLSKMSLYAQNILRTIVKAGHGQEVMDRLPEKIELDSIRDNYFSFLPALFEAGFRQEIVDKLPSNIDLNSAGSDGVEFLKKITEAGFADTILKRLRSNIDIQTMPKEAADLLLFFFKRGHINDILSKIDKFDVARLNRGGVAFITELISARHADLLSLYDLMPDKLDLASI